jgi:Gpi18-like mannosyltransferase
VEQPRRFALPALTAGAWILLATALNMVLATSAGFPYDSQSWANWTSALQHGGYTALVSDYPPLFIHWLWLCARLLDLLHLQAQDNALLHFLVVTPVLACHAVLLLLVDGAQRRLPQEQRLPWLLPFAALNPALLVDGPMWGQVDLLNSLMLAAALQLLISGRALALVVPLLAGALLTRFQAVCILPVAAPLLWRRRSPALWAGVLMALLLADLALLPYWMSDSAMRMLNAAYLDLVGRYPNASVNAWNLWFLLGLNKVDDGLMFLDAGRYPAFLVRMSAPRLLGELLFLAWSLWLLVSTWRSSEPHKLWRNALFSAAGFFLLLPGMHERDLFATVPLALLAAAACAGFARHAVALSLLAALNMLWVLGTQPDGPLPYLVSAALLLYIGGWAASTWGLRPQWLLRLKQRMETLPLWAGLAASALLWLIALSAQVQTTAPPPDAQGPLPPVVDGWMDASAIPGVGATQGWGTLHLGQSVEGRDLRVAGQSFAHGFGTHSPSQLDLPVPAGARRFSVSAGLDDEASGGRLAFKVFLDGHEAWNSGSMVNGDAPRTLDLDVSGHHHLQLVVDPLGDMDSDHADWLEPRFRIEP